MRTSVDLVAIQWSGAAESSGFGTTSARGGPGARLPTGTRLFFSASHQPTLLHSRQRPGQQGEQNVRVVEPFVPAVSDTELKDLQARLRATRWPDRETDERQGLALEDLQGLCSYWAQDYDWRRCERRLTSIGWFRTSIDGLDIAYLHAPSERADAFPLVLTHGWPGSVIEFVDTLEPLTAAGFSCVVPSLPGYGWSGKPTEPGWGVERIARAWAELMERLGYACYGAVGSDWGTSVSASLGQQDPAHVAGVHLVPPLAPPLPGTVRNDRRPQDAGYSTQQRTRPQTIGYSLVDSPAGLAAWIVEKIRSWTDPSSVLSLDQILDNVMHYWLPRTGASAARLYWESLGDVSRWLEGPLQALRTST